MKYNPPLQRATLIRRYKRFLADIELPSGEITTIHCPNTGSMKNCAVPGSEVWFSTSDNAKRKYPFTWELGRTSRGHYIGINTHKANQLIKGAIVDGVISELSGYSDIRTEVKYGNENSRIDILLESPGRESCYVEVKSVTLLESPVSHGRGYFPDAVSERGRKHLRELSAMKRQGYRAVLVYCVQHSGIQEVHPARHIDVAYADTLVEAMANGVEVMAYKCKMSSRDIKVVKSIPVRVTDGCE